MSIHLCACGCGESPLCKTSRYLRGHNSKSDDKPNWRGGRRIDKDGYVRIYSPNHPNRSKDGMGYVFEHILVMEKSIGRYLNGKEVVHHIDENKQNNNIGNLILFATSSMHMAYHYRLKAFKSCGNYLWRKCSVCHEYDDLKNMYAEPNGQHVYHRKCKANYTNNRRIKRRESLCQMP